MKIAIIGAAYTGFAAAEYLRAKGHEISVTTTGERRVPELEAVADRVVVMKGSDRDKMRELIAGQDVLLLTMAGGMVERDGKYVMDLDLYRDAYVGTAESVVEAIDAAPDLRQIVFTGSWSAYGNAGGADEVDEDTPATPASPFAQVYIDTENLLFGIETPERRVCVYRTGTIYGPQVGFVPRGLQASTLPMAGQAVPFDGNAPAAIIHRDDVVRALEFAVDNRLSGIYNLINDVTEKKEVFFGKIIADAGAEPINWVGAGTGPKSLSNRKLKDAGFSLGDPDTARDGSSFL
ncbi:MAG: NAD-dependent epimerase/dehydratase family protein [Gammaproteobacteria bacterium]|jgi:nucleoside-diphosphate-sugar epimerase|nr:NAD-dependent epimerase/dehydratase family protein [Gammaproteobacteria bacterium]MDP6616508.1 NAD-dependent epimerase/dehydratase family protein [Gammaproteobacteria bacterium]MDP6694243.1 NAD-dependent epimerase/dehydratase family protein [Gammaproteobacteria bacterium]